MGELTQRFEKWRLSLKDDDEGKNGKCKNLNKRSPLLLYSQKAAKEEAGIKKEEGEKNLN